MKEQNRHATKDHRDVGLTLIAIGKLIKVTLLLVAGVAALWFAHGHGQLASDGTTSALTSAAPGNHELHRLIAHVAGVSTRHLELLGVGSFVYAAVFATEGLGLWFQKKWAEYVTTFVTLSFIPLEIWEITQHATAIKVVMLLLNIAALVYLVWRLMADRAHAQLGNASR